MKMGNSLIGSVSLGIHTCFLKSYFLLTLESGSDEQY